MALDSTVGLRARTGLRRPAVSPAVYAPPLLLAAALAGAAEVLVHRVAGAVAPHVGTPAPLGRVLNMIGQAAMSLTALLVVATVIVLLLGGERRHRTPLGVVTMSAIVGILLGWAWLSHLGFLAAVTLVIWMLPRRIAEAPVAVIGAGLAAAVVSLSLGELGLRIVGEAAVVVGLVALAVVVVWERPGRSWLGAVVGSGVVAIALVFQPGYSALAALWAVGATLWLPSVAYIAVGGAVGMLLSIWLRNRQTRHLAWALLLLAVTGVPPSLIHHNVTGMLALIVLSSRTRPSIRSCLP